MRPGFSCYQVSYRVSYLVGKPGKLQVENPVGNQFSTRVETSISTWFPPRFSTSRDAGVSTLVSYPVENQVEVCVLVCSCVGVFVRLCVRVLRCLCA